MLRQSTLTQTRPKSGGQPAAHTQHRAPRCLSRLQRSSIMFAAHQDARLGQWRSPGRATRSRDRAKRSVRLYLEQLEARRLLNAGFLDHAFGADGMAAIDLPVLANQGI